MVLMVTFIAGASAQVGKKTVWDGVYTSEQANRGEETYDARCTGCHRDDLSGGGDGAAVLRGADFFARWNDKTVGALRDAVIISGGYHSQPSYRPEALRMTEDELFDEFVSMRLRSGGEIWARSAFRSNQTG
jgi:hypothetical protein